MRRQLAINLKYCYSARRVTQNMSASRSLPTIVLQQEWAINLSRRQLWQAWV